jgi:periplasmic divalent cation tolerance protein
LSRFVLVFCTASSSTESNRIADRLLSERAAACVNILPGLKSLYWWKGKRETAREWLLWIKTHSSKTRMVQRIIAREHSYQTPEILTVAIRGGSRKYLKWLGDEIKFRNRKRR